MDIGSEAAEKFERTVSRMLTTPPVKHSDMKKGAAPKRDPRSSGQGAKG